MHAGARPATMPVIMATRSVNKNTRESTCSCPRFWAVKGRRPSVALGSRCTLDGSSGGERLARTARTRALSV